MRRMLKKIIMNMYNYCFCYELHKDKNVRLRGFVSLTYNKKIKINGKVNINQSVHINAMGGVEIGDNVNISAGAMLISTGLVTDKDGLTDSHCSKKIIIGNNVQIGAGAIVLSGVNITNNVLVGAGSVVTKHIDIPGIYAGNPAKLINTFGS